MLLRHHKDYNEECYHNATQYADEETGDSRFGFKKDPRSDDHTSKKYQKRTKSREQRAESPTESTTGTVYSVASTACIADEICNFIEAEKGKNIGETEKSMHKRLMKRREERKKAQAELEEKKKEKPVGESCFVDDDYTIFLRKK